MKKLIALACLLFATIACPPADSQTRVTATRNTSNTFTGLQNQFTTGVQTGPVTFANLTNASLVNQADGTLIWVTDASAQNPCVGGGAGAFAFRENGAWDCSIAGGGGGGSGTVNAGTTNHLYKLVAPTTVGDSSVVDDGSTVSTTEPFSASTLTSTVSTGTAPFTVASTTVVPNLNVSQLLGSTWAAPANIGTGTPATGTFTVLQGIVLADKSANTNAAFTTAGTTGAVLFPPNYTKGTFTNSNNIPVLDFSSSRDFRAGSYTPRDFGAKGDGVTLRDGAIASGATAFSSSSATFTSSDVGKSIAVEGAGASGNVLVTTIASFTSSTSVGLTDTASTTVTNATTYYGTDDTVAVRTCVQKGLLLGGKCVLSSGAAFMVSNTASTISVNGSTFRPGGSLEGSGTVIFAPRGTLTGGVNDRFLYLSSREPFSPWQVAAGAIAKGATSFTAQNSSDAANLSPGDYVIFVENDDGAGGNAVYYDWSIVSSVAGTTVNLVYPFRMAFPNARPYVTSGGVSGNCLTTNPCGLSFRKVDQIVSNFTLKDFSLIIPGYGNNLVAAIVTRDTLNGKVENINCSNRSMNCVGAYLDRGLTINANHFFSNVSQEISACVNCIVTNNNSDIVDIDASPIRGGGFLLDFAFGFGIFSNNTIHRAIGAAVDTFFGMHDSVISGNTINWLQGNPGGSCVHLVGAYENLVTSNVCGGGSGTLSGISSGGTTTLTVNIPSSQNQILGNHIGSAVSAAYDCDTSDVCFDTYSSLTTLPIHGAFDASASTSFKPRSTIQANPNSPLIPCDFPDVIESSTSTPGQTHWTCTSHNVWTQNLNSGSGGGGTWGSITGTLSAQTDLQTALNGKLATGLAVLLTPGATQTIQPSLSTAIALAGKCPAGAGSTLACLEALDNTGAVIFAALQNGTTQFGTGVGGDITLTSITGPNANPATAGQVRLSSTDTGTCWRSNDNTTNYCLAKTSADVITSDRPIAVKETVAGSGIAGYGVIYEDSTTHVPMWSANNGSFLTIPQETGAMTSGHLVSVNATTNLIQDSGLVLSSVLLGTPTNHAVLVSGAAQTVTMVGPGTAGQCLISGGAAADPAYGLCGGGGGASLDAITAAVGSATINNGDNAIRWNWQGSTAGRIGFLISENAASTSTGTPVLFQVSAIAGSTMSPVQFDFNGNGIRIGTDGKVTALGTGGIPPTALTSVTGSGAVVRQTNATTVTMDAEGTGNVLTRPVYIEFAPGCNVSTGNPGAFDVPTSIAPTFTCFGTTTTLGAVDFVDGSTTQVTGHFTLPQGWTGNLDARIHWFGGTASSNAVRWLIQTGCVADSESISGGPSYNAAGATNSAYTGTANQRQTATISAIPTTNCAAGETMFFLLNRIGGDAGDTYAATAELVDVQFEARATK